MTSDSKRPRFRIHLSTALAASIVAGTLVGANIIPYETLVPQEDVARARRFELLILKNHILEAEHEEKVPDPNLVDAKENLERTDLSNIAIAFGWPFVREERINISGHEITILAGRRRFDRNSAWFANAIVGITIIFFTIFFCEKVVPRLQRPNASGRNSSATSKR
jgi:hypothetical protein